MTAIEEGPGGQETIRYGSHADQWIELSQQSGYRRGTAVFIHGGYWRPPFTLDMMRPLVPSFTERGWAVANIEYRRGAEGWAATAADLDAAMAAVRSAADAGPIVIVGHSVGGQLALLGGRDGDLVVALAPVTDLVRGYREGIGDGAVAEFFLDSPDDAPDLYVSASPAAQLPPRGEVLVVHGHDDARVPFDHTRGFVAAARESGADVTFLELPHLEHRAAIDPQAPHWPDVHDWLDGRVPGPAL